MRIFEIDQNHKNLFKTFCVLNIDGGGLFVSVYRLDCAVQWFVTLGWSGMKIKWTGILTKLRLFRQFRFQPLQFVRRLKFWRMNWTYLLSSHEAMHVFIWPRNYRKQSKKLFLFILFIRVRKGDDFRPPKSRLLNPTTTELQSFR